jgi:hypothetical protein
MSSYRLVVKRDEQEDLLGQQKIDSLIFKLFIAMIIIVPLIVSSGLDFFNSPILENESTYISGIKGDVFALHKAIAGIIFAIIIIILFTFKVILLNYKIKKSPLSWFLLASGTFVVIATLFAPYKILALFGLPSRYDGGMMYLCYLFLFFIALEIKYPKNALQYVAYAFIPFIIINFIISSMSFYGKDALSYEVVKKVTTAFLPEGVQLSEGSMLIGTLSHGNYMSGSTAIIAILFLAISIGENHIGKKLMFLMLSLLSSAITLMSLASSGFVTLAAMMVLIILLTIKSENRMKSLIVLASFLLTFAGTLIFLSNHNSKVWSESVGFFISNNPFEVQEAASESLLGIIQGLSVSAADNTKFQLPELPESGVGPGSGRLFIWDRTLKLVMERPLTGYGFDTLPFFFPQNDPEKHAQIETYQVTVDKPHSMYMGILYSTGIIGFLAFLGVFVLSVFYSIRWLLKAKLQKSTSIYLSAFVLAWGAYLIQAVFNDTVVGNSLHMWIVGGIVTVFAVKYKKGEKVN